MGRLTEFDPRWIGYEGERLGLSFKCPHCKDQRLAVAFHRRGHELIDDTHIRAAGSVNYIWTVDGDSFENLSLTPSVDASQHGHWHGHITDGEIR